MMAADSCSTTRARSADSMRAAIVGVSRSSTALTRSTAARCWSISFHDGRRTAAPRKDQQMTVLRPPAASAASNSLQAARAALDRLKSDRITLGTS